MVLTSTLHGCLSICHGMVRLVKMAAVLYSDPFSNYYDAEEKVAESVLEYYQSNRRFEINGCV